MSRGFSDCCHYDDGYDDGYDDAIHGNTKDRRDTDVDTGAVIDALRLLAIDAFLAGNLSDSAALDRAADRVERDGLAARLAAGERASSTRRGRVHPSAEGGGMNETGVRVNLVARNDVIGDVLEAVPV
jgi:hypothetical protein